MRRNNFTRRLFVGLLSISMAGCGNPQLQSLGSSILSSTGLVSQSQADSFFAAGGKLAKAAGPMTAEQEYYVGRAVAAMILKQYPMENNAALNAYVNRVGNVVAAYSDMPETYGGYHFVVLKSDELNALSAPGGFVFISKGLLKTIKNEDALAAVLAHEVGHVVKGHGVKAISQSNLTDALVILGKEAANTYGGATTQELTGLFGDSVNQVFDTLVKNGYSRSQEYEADEYGAELLKRSGYSPKALITMLEAVDSASASAKTGGWLDTHPSAKKRISEVEEYVEKAPAETAGFKVRAARFKQSVHL